MNFSRFLRLARIHQPTGIWLLFLPCLFGVFLAIKEPSSHDFNSISYIIFLFFIGSIIMRSAGCIINDLIDREFDAQVERTKNRPLATGEISHREAFVFLLILLLLGLIILMQFNLPTIFSGFLALTLIISYPMMKRITYYPQVFLGLTFNFGIIMGSLAITGSIGYATILLYISATIWTVIYDTVYAFQDIENDLQVGIKSTAIKFRKEPKTVLRVLNLVMFLILLFLGIKETFTEGYFIIIFASILFLDYKIKNCHLNNPYECLGVFKANFWVGVLILIAIILG